jgi:hypothetical protein
MALDTYDNLVKEIIDWSHRDDLGTKIDDFIDMAEVAMYSNDQQPLRVRSMETITTASTDDSVYLALPDDYEYARSVRLVVDDNNGELMFKSPEQLKRKVGTGRPRFYTVVGGQFEFERIPDQVYTVEVQYFKKATPLSTINQTNEILTQHPQIYLFGALTEVFAYAQDEQQEAKYFAKFINAIKGANKADKKARFGPSPSMSIEGTVV